MFQCYRVASLPSRFPPFTISPCFSVIGWPVSLHTFYTIHNQPTFQCYRVASLPSHVLHHSQLAHVSVLQGGQSPFTRFPPFTISPRFSVIGWPVSHHVFHHSQLAHVSVLQGGQSNTFYTIHNQPTFQCYRVASLPSHVFHHSQLAHVSVLQGGQSNTFSTIHNQPTFQCYRVASLPSHVFHYSQLAHVSVLQGGQSPFTRFPPFTISPHFSVIGWPVSLHMFSTIHNQPTFQCYRVASLPSHVFHHSQLAHVSVLQGGQSPITFSTIHNQPMFQCYRVASLPAHVLHHSQLAHVSVLQGGQSPISRFTPFTISPRFSVIGWPVSLHTFYTIHNQPTFQCYRVASLPSHVFHHSQLAHVSVLYGGQSPITFSTIHNQPMFQCYRVASLPSRFTPFTISPRFSVIGWPVSHHVFHHSQLAHVSVLQGGQSPITFFTIHNQPTFRFTPFTIRPVQGGQSHTFYTIHNQPTFQCYRVASLPSHIFHHSQLAHVSVLQGGQSPITFSTIHNQPTFQCYRVASLPSRFPPFTISPRFSVIGWPVSHHVLHHSQLAHVSVLQGGQSPFTRFSPFTISPRFSVIGWPVSHVLHHSQLAHVSVLQGGQSPFTRFPPFTISPRFSVIGWPVSLHTFSTIHNQPTFQCYRVASLPSHVFHHSQLAHVSVLQGGQSPFTRFPPFTISPRFSVIGWPVSLHTFYTIHNQPTFQCYRVASLPSHVFHHSQLAHVSVLQGGQSPFTRFPPFTISPRFSVIGWPVSHHVLHHSQLAHVSVLQGGQSPITRFPPFTISPRFSVIGWPVSLHMFFTIHNQPTFQCYRVASLPSHVFHHSQLAHVSVLKGGQSPITRFPPFTISPRFSVEGWPVSHHTFSTIHNQPTFQC